MAQIQLMNLLPPVAIGGLSAAGELLERNRKATGADENVFFDNAGMITDIVVSGYALVNHMMDLGFPRQGSVEGLGAGVAVLTRRFTNMIGANVLGLTSSTTKTTARLSPGRGSRARLSPGAAVETAPRSRKRQFFSVT